jgi:hypothetical protein
MLHRARAGLLLLIAVTAASARLHAIDFQHFDALPLGPQAEHIGEMVASAEQALRDEGRNDLADKVRDLFATTLQGDSFPLGLVELERNVARGRVADLNRVQKDANATRLDVEDALFVTLQKNDIFTDAMPDAVMRRMADFRSRTVADLLAMDPGRRRAAVASLIAVAVPDFLMRQQLNAAAGQDQTRYADNATEIRKLVERDFAGVIGVSGSSSGLDDLIRRLQAKTDKTQPALLAMLQYFNDVRIAALERDDAALRQKVERMYDTGSVVLADGRHVLRDNAGEFHVITRGFEDPGILLEGLDKVEAQQIYDCVNGGRSDCAPPPRSTTTNYWPAPPDDPFGGGSAASSPSSAGSGPVSVGHLLSGAEVRFDGSWRYANGAAVSDRLIAGNGRPPLTPPQQFSIAQPPVADALQEMRAIAAGSRSCSYHQIADPAEIIMAVQGSGIDLDDSGVLTSRTTGVPAGSAVAYVYRQQAALGNLALEKATIADAGCVMLVLPCRAGKCVLDGDAASESMDFELSTRAQADTLLKNLRAIAQFYPDGVGVLRDRR